LAAFGPEAELHLRHFLAGHNASLLLGWQQEDIFGHLVDGITIVAQDGGQRRLLNLR
jgi:hypothetical protein